MGYYVHLNKQNSGPFSEEEIRAKFHGGEINGETLVANEGDTAWIPLSKTGLTQARIRLKMEEIDSTSPAPASTALPQHDVQSSGSLQFDRADFAETKSGVVACSICKQTIHDSYYQINRLVTCTACKERVEASGAGRLTLVGFGKSLLFGLGAAIAGSAVWYGVREVTGYELGLIGIAVGLMVGVAVKRGSHGWGGWQYQMLAMLLTYFAIAGTYVPPLLKAVNSHPPENSQPATTATGAGASNDNPADDPNAPSDPAAGNSNPHHKSALVGALHGLPKPVRYLAACVMVFALACAVPFLTGAENFLGWIIIGIALYQAWKINRRVPLDISGPYAIAPKAAAI